MSGPLLPGDHYVLRKLCNEVLIWMIGARTVRRQWFVWLADVYRYGGDLAAALAGAGIGAPLARALSEKPADDNSALEALHGALSGAWFWFGIAALLAWLFLRVFAQNENIVARALLAREHTRSMQALYQQMWGALHEPEPMTKVIEIQKQVDTKVQDAIRSDIWPWDPPPPPPDALEAALRIEVDQIRATFMSRWNPPPPGVV